MFRQMEKKEKKADLEQLLNSLIEKGWDAFPDKKFFGNKDKLRFSKGKKCVWFGNDDYTLRELVSKESGLWQFVCENGMVKKSIISREYFNTLGGCRITFRDENMAFWLIESALKDESELEEFLLSNIKVDEKD